MAITFGPKLGLAVNGLQGEEHYAQLMAMWRALDALIQPSVIDHTLSAPPGSPADGDCYIVATSPSGAWAGQTNKIARYSSVLSAWEFYTPLPGWIAFSNEAGDHLKFVDGSWVALSTPPAPDDIGFNSAAGSAFLSTGTLANDTGETDGTISDGGIAIGFPRSSGKRYFEFAGVIGTASTRDAAIGFIEQSYFDSYSEPSDSYTSHTGSGAQVNPSLELRSQNTLLQNIGGSFSFSTVFMFAVDLDAGVFYFGRGGVWEVGDPVAGTGGESFGHAPGVVYRPLAAFYNAFLRARIQANADSLNYSPPTGFVPWND